MESKERKLCNSQLSRIKTEKKRVWMNESSLMATRKQEYKEILLLGFIKCKSLNDKALNTKLFERWYDDMTSRGHTWG
jgi:hypothetical protein